MAVGIEWWEPCKQISAFLLRRFATSANLGHRGSAQFFDNYIGIVYITAVECNTNNNQQQHHGGRFHSSFRWLINSFDAIVINGKSGIGPRLHLPTKE